jgi:hypothetical protein
MPAMTRSVIGVQSSIALFAEPLVMRIIRMKDDVRFPDIRHQLLEVKLQTSPTIDLGLVRPDSEEFLDLPALQDVTIRHCDVRYLLFYARIDYGLVSLTHMYLTTGEAFFRRFQ